jgi:hypothetical protein
MATAPACCSVHVWEDPGSFRPERWLAPGCAYFHTSGARRFLPFSDGIKNCLGQARCSARCPLPAAGCPLPAARCPLPAARCSLPAARCLLPAASASFCCC